MTLIRTQNAVKVALVAQVRVKPVGRHLGLTIKKPRLVVALANNKRLFNYYAWFFHAMRVELIDEFSFRQSRCRLLA